MNMLMLVFRSSLKERVHELLEQGDVRAYTEIPETIGAGQTGPAEGVSFYPGVNSASWLQETMPMQSELSTA